MVLDLLNMDKDELLNLNPNNVDRELLPDEIFHIFKALNALWLYDYEAAKEGKVGLHAKLKSGNCSDGFLNSKIVLQHDNLRKILAQQMVMKFNGMNWSKPTHIAGIPDGATKLGEDVADIMGVKRAEMVKENGKIKMVTQLQHGETILFVEDFCTKATGFKEAVMCIKDSNIIMPFELVVVNRGGLKYVNMHISVHGNYKIVSLAEHRINDWKPSECPLCKTDSKRIKPKEPEENWQLITTSQL